MKATIPSAIILSFFLGFAIPARAGAQAGNDFPPFLPGLPPFAQPWIPGNPLPPGNGDWKSGTKFGPLQIQNKKGDTIVVGYKLDWGLPLATTAIVASSATKMHYDGPAYGVGPAGAAWEHPGLGYWCIGCQWSIEAGDDNITLQIDFIGNDYWHARLEVFDIIPAPQHPTKFNVFSKEEKDRAAYWAPKAAGARDILSGLAAGTCIWGGKTWLCKGLSAGAFGAASLAGYLGSIDPWDDSWEFPVGVQDHTNDPGVYGLEYIGDPDVDHAVYSVIVVADYLQAALTSIDRASTAGQLEQYDYAAFHINEIYYFQRVVGMWAQIAANDLYSLRARANNESEYEAADGLQAGLETLWYIGDVLR